MNKQQKASDTGFKRLKVLGRHYVYDPETARHVELDSGAWHTLGRMTQGRAKSLGELAAISGRAQFFEVPLEMSGAADPPALRSLILQASHACNLRCQYCSADFGRYGGGFREMSAKTAERAVNFLFDTSPSDDLAITYFGGEPLLNLDTVLFSARHARKRAAREGRKLSVHLVTNGVLLNPQTLFRLDELDFSLTVSLDGEKACHDVCRPFPDGSGSHRTICSNLAVAAKLPIGRRITVRGTFTRQDAAFFRNVRFLVEAGFSRNIAYEPVFLPHSHALSLRWQDLADVKRSYEDLARYYVHRWRQGNPFCLWDFDDAVIRVAQAIPRQSRCGSGVTTLAITAEENLYACHMSTGMADAKLGNLRQGVSACRCRPWREKYLSGRTGCTGCWLRALCGGGCNTHSLFYNRCLGQPYRLECALIEHRYRLAFWILSEIPSLQKALATKLTEEDMNSGHLLNIPLWAYQDPLKQ